VKVEFLSTDEVLAMQERLIDCFGGTHGVRDPGILESGTCDYEHLLPWMKNSIKKA